MRPAAFALPLALALPAPAALDAAALPVAPQFRVNATAAGEQSSPDLAADGADNFRIVWQTTAGDPVHFDVRIRRLAANGTLGTDSALAESTTRDQRSPRVAITPGGDWAAIWTSDHVTADEDRPYGRLTTEGGTILGAEFAFHADAATDAAAPAVAVVADDYLAGTWRNSSGGTSVRGNFRSRGNLSFGISAIAVAESGTRTAVAGLAVSRWVAVWQAADADASGVYVRCHSYDDATESASLAHPVVTGDQEYPDVASDGAFHFVVVWQQDFAIFARRFAVDAVTDDCDPVGDVIPVSTPGDPALFPSVDMAADGAFVVAWYENTFDADNGIAAREFTKEGIALGAPFAVNDVTLGAQAAPSVAISAGQIAFAWTTPDSGGGGDRDIAARRFFRQTLFSDGFEAGDPFAWSLAVP